MLERLKRYAYFTDSVGAAVMVVMLARNPSRMRVDFMVTVVCSKCGQEGDDIDSGNTNVLPPRDRNEMQRS